MVRTCSMPKRHNAFGVSNILYVEGNIPKQGGSSVLAGPLIDLPTKLHTHTPKYWCTGEHTEVGRSKACLVEFLEQSYAAHLTRHTYTQTPKRIF